MGADGQLVWVCFESGVSDICYPLTGYSFNILPARPRFIGLEMHVCVLSVHAFPPCGPSTMTSPVLPDYFAFALTNAAWNTCMNRQQSSKVL